MKKFAPILLLLPLATVVHAEPAPEPVDAVPPAAASPWSGEVEFGLIRTTGNSSSNSVNGKAQVQYERARWIHSASLAALNSTSNGVTTARSYTFNGKSKFSLQQREYVFANLLYQADHLSGYRSQVSETLGYGRRVIDRPRLFLDLEAGGGARQSQPKTGPNVNEFIARGLGNLEWKIGTNSVFSQNLTIESGRNNTQTQSVTALKAKVEGNLAMKLSYTVKHNTFVPAGNVNTETIASAALVMDF
jgi:putative salt-induced outer membrane protein